MGGVTQDRFGSDRQTGRQTGRQADSQAYRQTGRQADRFGLFRYRRPQVSLGNIGNINRNKPNF